MRRSFSQLVVTAMLLLLISILQLAHAGDRSFRKVEANRYAGGQPSAEDVAALKAQGVRHIINLRTDSEVAGAAATGGQGEDGITYHRLPVAGASGVTLENAQRLDSLLAQIGDEPTLLHCASGNRVGALIALRAGLAGSDPDDALKKGRQWGLSSLEGVVKQRLQSLPNNEN